MWFYADLDDVVDPGDKGIGLQELETAGLMTPRTLVFSDVRLPKGSHELVDVSEFFLSLGLRHAGAQVMVRSSVSLERQYAAAVSGLYLSAAAKAEDFLATLESVAESYSGPDRDKELALMGGLSKEGRPTMILVQPYIEPDFSGVAHVGDTPAGLHIRVGIIDGHLSRLVEGKEPGWQCEITSAEIAGEVEVAVVGYERDLENIYAQVEARGVLLTLYSSLKDLITHVRTAREVEWVAKNGRVWFLQSQPTSALENAYMENE